MIIGLKIIEAENVLLRTFVVKRNAGKGTSASNFSVKQRYIFNTTQS